MEHTEQDMKISPITIRRLRTERGWSQEQLAAASGLGLRTIQRVEAEGKAARETRVCLAATFGVGLAELINEPAQHEIPLAVPDVLRYKVALVAAGLALLPVLLYIAGIIANSLLVSGCFMAVIALGLYGGFGWYFTCTLRHVSRLKHYVQVAFIAAAIFSAFAVMARSEIAALGMAAQVTALAVGLYCILDYLLSRRRASK